MVRVLLVEDDDLFASAVEALLERESDVVVVGRARNARDGLDLIASEKPQVVVMDLAMPGMDGIAALKELKGRNDCATVLILSASTSDETGGEAMASGADAFLSKGRALDDLAPLIRELAARAG
jgi:two-component system invasion response regulator UvrY